MTINEIHIAVNLGVQKIASFQADNLLPEEIDHEFNLAMLRFVKQRYNPTSNRLGKGFEQSQKRIDDLRALVSESIKSTFNVGTMPSSIGSYIFNSSFSGIFVDRLILPNDYMFLISVRGEMNYSCGSSISDDYVEVQKFVAGVKVGVNPPASGYKLTNIEWGFAGLWNTIINNPNGLGEELTTEMILDRSNYNFNLVPTINFPAEGSLDDSIQVNAPLDSGHIYINADSAIWELLEGGYVRTTWVYNQDMSTAIYVVEPEKEEVSVIQRTAPTANRAVTLCHFAQHDDILWLQDDPFNRTHYKYAYYTLEENYIDIHTDNTFVVPRATIKYIRHPKPVSKSAGIGCELPAHTHPEIVEMTIKSILEGIESPRYPSQSMENLESE